MASDREVEIKFRIEDMDALTSRLKEANFRLVTPRTHELNTLFDQPGGDLRRQGALLRLRQYGPQWTLTYKGKSDMTGPHKSRTEIETRLEDGEAATRIIRAIGFQPGFRYEKFRTEWSDSTGHVVLDETPVGNYGEIEGPPDWIDSTARLLRITPGQYIRESYSELFLAWKEKTGSGASEMTFDAVKLDR
jgi:adenylate cyclase class 2